MRLRSLKSNFRLAASIAVLAAAPAAFAQMPDGKASAPDEAGAAAANAVGQVVVTAHRSEALATRVGQSFTVLTAKQIHNDQETSLAEILARTPGISITRNGGPGETAALFIRGADSDQVVVLIDGVKVNDPTDPGDGYDFANLITGDTARIEVLRGAQSTLYGSQAIGGVVNVITADATKPIQADLQAEGGSYGTAYVRGGVGGKMDRFDWRLGAYYNTSDGVSAYYRGKEPDGFRADGYSGQFRFDILPNLQLDERAYYMRNKADFDGFDTPTFTFGDDREWGRTTQFIDYTGLNLSLLDGRFKSRLAYEYSGVDRLSIDPDMSPDQVFVGTGRTNTVEYEGTFAISPNYQAVFGAVNEQSSMVESSPAFFAPRTSANATITGGYAQVTGEVVQGLSLTGGVRYDSHSTFGGHFTGQASAAWTLNDGNTILRASFGEGFKAPSLYQLYSEYGNRMLSPEQSESWDAGIEQHFLDGKIVLQATYFGRDTRNLIDFVSCFGAPAHTGLCDNYPVFQGYYDNIGRASAEGVELQASWQPIDALSLTANYTYTDAEDLTARKQLSRRPRNVANFSAAYTWPIKLRTEVAVRYAGDSYNDAANFRRLAAYTLVDLRASYPINDHLEVYGRIENVADTHYHTIYQYGTLGRAAYGGVSLKF